MKRKILILLCAVCLLLSFSVTAFASSLSLPTLNDRDYFIYRDYNLRYSAIFVDDVVSVNDTWVAGKITDGYYRLEGNKWVYSVLSDGQDGRFNLAKGSLVFDKSGTLGVANRVLFVDYFDIDDGMDYFLPLATQLNVKTVVAVVAVGASAVVGIVFMWWGVRKLANALVKAFKKGHVKI